LKEWAVDVRLEPIVVDAFLRCIEERSLDLGRDLAGHRIFFAASATVPSNQCRLEPRQDVKLSDPSIRVGRRECGLLDHESELYVAV
jgi:hypothetical protein